MNSKIAKIEEKINRDIGDPETGKKLRDKQDVDLEKFSKLAKKMREIQEREKRQENAVQVT